MDTNQIILLVDELVNLGTKCIIFDGGEVLLKEGLKRIFDYCSNKGIYVVLNSNGTLVKEKIKEISAIDEIKLSLDGPRPVQDFIRGKDGTYDKVIEAIRVLKDRGKKVYINTVLSKCNLSSFSHVLEVGERLKIGAFFQPATQNLLGSGGKDHFSPPIDGYRKVIEFLISEKNKGNKVIRNSIAGLKHLYNYPKPTEIFCLAKFLHCSIEPDGRITSCDRLLNYEKFLVPVNGDFKKAFKNINTPYCASCWCGTMVDFNLAGNFNLDALRAMWTTIRK